MTLLFDSVGPSVSRLTSRLCQASSPVLLRMIVIQQSLHEFVVLVGELPKVHHVAQNLTEADTFRTDQVGLLQVWQSRGRDQGVAVSEEHGELKRVRVDFLVRVKISCLRTPSLRRFLRLTLYNKPGSKASLATKSSGLPMPIKNSTSMENTLCTNPVAGLAKSSAWKGMRSISDRNSAIECADSICSVPSEPEANREDAAAAFAPIPPTFELDGPAAEWPRYLFDLIDDGSILDAASGVWWTDDEDLRRFMVTSQRVRTADCEQMRVTNFVTTDHLRR